MVEILSSSIGFTVLVAKGEGNSVSQTALFTSSYLRDSQSAGYPLYHDQWVGHPSLRIRFPSWRLDSVQLFPELGGDEERIQAIMNPCCDSVQRNFR